MILTSASKLSTIRTLRAGVLPYTVVRNSQGQDEVWYLIARDRKSIDWSDFGGGVKKYEYSLDAGFREFNEESRSVLGSVCKSPNALSSSAALVNKGISSVIMYPVDPNRLTDVSDMYSQYEWGPRGKQYNETDCIQWVSEHTFWALVHGQKYEYSKMWSVCRKFYSLCDRRELSLVLKRIHRLHYP